MDNECRAWRIRGREFHAASAFSRMPSSDMPSSDGAVFSISGSANNASFTSGPRVRAAANASVKASGLRVRAGRGALSRTIAAGTARPSAAATAFASSGVRMIRVWPHVREALCGQRAGHAFSPRRLRAVAGRAARSLRQAAARVSARRRTALLIADHAPLEQRSRSDRAAGAALEAVSPSRDHDRHGMGIRHHRPSRRARHTEASVGSVTDLPELDLVVPANFTLSRAKTVDVPPRATVVQAEGSVTAGRCRPHPVRGALPLSVDA